MSPPPLSLHSASLTLHASSLTHILLCVETLVSPSPPTFHGPHVAKTRLFLHSLADVLSQASALLSAAVPTVVEGADDARSILQDDLHPEETVALFSALELRTFKIASQLSSVANAFRNVTREADSVATVLGDAERDLARSRGPLGLAVVSSEETAAAARKGVLDARRRLNELEGILKDARREERIAARKLFFARCASAFRGTETRMAVANMKKTRDVAKRAARDKTMLLKRLADVQGNYLRRSSETRRMQGELVEKEECWRAVIGRYGAIRSLAGSVAEVSGLWERLALSCKEAVEKTKYGESLANARITIERWHTISVALRVFHSDHTDAVHCMLKYLEQ